jgi:hypothetical protein
MVDKVASILEINIFYKKLSDFLIHSEELFDKKKEADNLIVLNNLKTLNAANFLGALISNIDEIGNGLNDPNDAFFNFLAVKNLNAHISNIYGTIVIVKEFLDKDITLADKSSIKNELIKIINSFNNSKKSLYEFNNSIDDLIKNISASQEKSVEIKEFLNYMKLEIEKSNKIVQKVNIKIETINKIIVFNQEYFEKRMENVKEILNMNQEPSEFLEPIFNILTLLSIKNKKDNSKIIGLFTDINNQENYIGFINRFIVKLKKLLKKDIVLKDKMSSNDKEFLKQNYKIDIKDDYENKMIKIFGLINELKTISNDAESMKLLVEFSKEMIDNKKLEIFKEIYTTEIQILIKLKDDKLIDSTFTFDSPFSKIDEILNYSTLDEKELKLMELESKNASFKDELKRLALINKNLNDNLKNNYSEAKNKLKDIKAVYADTIKSKEYLIKDSSEENKKEAIKKIRELSLKINKFSKLIFEDFDETEKEFDKDKCIFSNELRKTKYFYALSQLIVKLKDKDLIEIPSEIKKKNDNIKNLIKVYNNIKKDFVNEKSTNIIKEEELNQVNISKESLEKFANAVDKIVNFMEKMKGFFKEMNTMRIDDTILKKI